MLEDKLRSGLEQAIRKWVEESEEFNFSDFSFLHLGEETTYRMADAALSVLLAIADAQQQAIDDGELVRPT